MELKIPDKDLDMWLSLFHAPHPCSNQPKQKPGHDSYLPLNAHSPSRSVLFCLLPSSDMRGHHLAIDGLRPQFPMESYRAVSWVKRVQTLEF